MDTPIRMSLSGDSLSQLVQVIGRQCKLQGWRYTGDGVQDLRGIVSGLVSQTNANKELMTALARITRIPRIADLIAHDENVEAEIAIAILRGRAALSCAPRDKSDG